MRVLLPAVSSGSSMVPGTEVWGEGAGGLIPAI